jgi:hypothetical protein
MILLRDELLGRASCRTPNGESVRRDQHEHVIQATGGVSPVAVGPDEGWAADFGPARGRWTLME